MSDKRATSLPISGRALLIGSALFVLAGCDSNYNLDLGPRGLGGGSGLGAVTQTAEARPAADNRGVISYPNYQVAVAKSGDTVASVAARIGLGAQEVGKYNGLDPATALRRGEILALPRRVSEPSPATGALTTEPIEPSGQIDITTLANDAIARTAAGKSTGKPAPAAARIAKAQKPHTEKPRTGLEPIRHKVERGETAYSISRLYNVSVRSLAQWNGLGSDLAVRVGQYLLIPVAAAPLTPARGKPSRPVRDTTPPLPPSAAEPLPAINAEPIAAIPPSPNLGTQRTKATRQTRLGYPVKGKIIRGFVRKKTDGIDIAAPAGTPVKAAENGVVATITEDTNGVPIIVLRHKGGRLTIYANVDRLIVKQGDTVKRGQKIAEVRAAAPSFLHFEVYEGVVAVDPVPYLN